MTEDIEGCEIEQGKDSSQYQGFQKNMSLINCP